MKEIWKDIVGYEGYQVSNLGRVRNKKGKILTLKLSKPTKRSNIGYLQAHLWKNGKGKFYTVHRLVWIAFNGEIPQGFEVNHIDENKYNNRLDNLNLLTSKENKNWGTRNKRIADALKGRKRPSEIFEKLRRPIEAVNEDGTIVYTFVSISEAERNGFSRTAIKACVNNRYWNNKGKNIYKDLIWRYA